MWRAVVAVLAVSLSLTGASALAAPGENARAHPSTDVYHDLTDTFTDYLPCSDAIYIFTIDYRNAVAHTTEFSTGTSVGAFLESATFTAIPADDPSLPSYTGHFAFHAVLSNRHLEPGATDVAGAQTIHATGSDGSKIHFHDTTQAVFSEEGDLLSGFEKAFCK